MKNREITLTGGEAGGHVLEVTDEKTVTIKVTRTENEDGEILTSFEQAKEGYVYEVRGDVGVYIGESSEIK